MLPKIVCMTLEKGVSMPNNLCGLCRVSPISTRVTFIFGIRIHSSNAESEFSAFCGFHFVFPPFFFLFLFRFRFYFSFCDFRFLVLRFRCRFSLLLKRGKILTQPLTKAFSANTAGSGTWPSAMPSCPSWKSQSSSESPARVQLKGWSSL